MATYYLIEAGAVSGGNTPSDSNNGLSWATAKYTFSAAQAAMTNNAGDSLYIAKTADPVTLSTNVSATFGNNTITLSAQNLVRTIDQCENVWIGSTNVTPGRNSSSLKQGTYSCGLTVAAAFTTGKIAYNTLSALDLSPFQKISLWFRSDIVIAANTLRLDLCSDVSGNTPVNSFVIPQIFGAATWNCFTLNYGSTLGNNINSIALVALSDPGTVVINLDNIIACNDFSLNSLISHTPLYNTRQSNTSYNVGDIVIPTTSAMRIMTMRCVSAGTTSLTEPTYPDEYKRRYTDGTAEFEVYEEDTSQIRWPLRSINGTLNSVTTIELDAGQGSIPSSSRGWCMPTGQYTIRYENPINVDLPLGTASLNVANKTLSKSGNINSITNYIGGWNPATSAIDGITLYDGINGFGNLPLVVANSYIKFANFGYTRYNNTVTNVAGSNGIVQRLQKIINSNFTAQGFALAANRNTEFVDLISVCTPTAFNSTINTDNSAKMCNFIAYGCTSNAFNGWFTVPINRYVAINNGGYAFTNAGGTNGVVCYINYFKSNGNTNGILVSQAAITSRLRLQNCSIGETNEVVFGTTNMPSYIFSENHDLTPQNNKLWAEGVLGTYYTSGGYNNYPYWRYVITSTIRTSAYPFRLGGYGVDAGTMMIKLKNNTPTTASLYIRRSNVNANVKLICEASNYNIESSYTATTVGDWELLTITINPKNLISNYILHPIYLFMWDGNGLDNFVDVCGPLIQRDV